MANFLKSLFVKGVEIDPAGATSAQVLSYNGTKFVPTAAAAGGSSVTVSDTAPVSPTAGDVWYESDTGILFVRYDSYWVEVGGHRGAAGAAGPGDALIANPLSQFAATTSAQLAGVISDETGTGSLVFSASPAFTGTPTLPTGTIATTQTAADSSTKVATTAFVTTADNLKANLASPTFTGTPTLPTGTIATTQTAGNNTTAVATTAFANAAGGLVYITSVAVGTGVTYVDITNVFSSTYDNYRIIWGGGYGSVASGLGIRVGGSSSDYSHVLHWSTPGFGGVNLDSSASTTQCNYMGGFTTFSGSLACDINNPFKSSLHTSFLEGAYISSDMGSCRGRHNIAQSNTSVTVICLSGTITGGTITVYGYRKA